MNFIYLQGSRKKCFLKMEFKNKLNKGDFFFLVLERVMLYLIWFLLENFLHALHYLIKAKID